jgi:hypothetical protein
LNLSQLSKFSPSLCTCFGKPHSSLLLSGLLLTLFLLSLIRCSSLRPVSRLSVGIPRVFAISSLLLRLLFLSSSGGLFSSRVSEGLNRLFQIPPGQAKTRLRY